MKTIALIIILISSGYSYAQNCDQFTHQFVEAKTNWNKNIQSILDFQKNTEGKNKDEINYNAFYSSIQEAQRKLKNQIK